MRTPAEFGERGPDGGDEGEEVDVEVLLPLFDGNAVRSDLAHRFEHASVQNDTINALVFLHATRYSRADSSSISPTVLTKVPGPRRIQRRTHTSHSKANSDSL